MINALRTYLKSLFARPVSPLPGEHVAGRRNVAVHVVSASACLRNA
ncbi:MAG: hypothetical protein ABL951_02740 [Alphaproteobacteria bacterium]